MAEHPLQFVTPLPPLPTGIAQYSRDLLGAINGRWPLTIVPEHGSSVSGVPSFPTASSVRSDLPVIYQLGNSGYHRVAYRNVRRSPGLLVLHDVVLHQGRLAEILRAGSGAEYIKLMRASYGERGASAASRILSGRQIDDIGEFPLFEDFVEAARLTVVHSEYARGLVQRFVPGAEVRVVPMGVPLPALVDQREAREALGLPADAFVVASITHVNPYKRLPVVLRALRRLLVHVPDAVLVVAGSVSPEINLARQVQLLNLERNVRLLGYVTDDQARLVARAADVCVNLRYPSAGETSASLLRLLGAGRPVLVTDDVPMEEYPRDAVLPVPIDRHEDEMVADLLLMLARESDVRTAAGAAARRFIERQHSLSAMVSGYRAAIAEAFGIQLPMPEPIEQYEREPVVERDEPAIGPYSTLDSRIADALMGLRLAGHDATIQSVARAAVDLRLDRLSVDR
jgi:glycosyltransferase involved in cell wall biosynthesis